MNKFFSVDNPLFAFLERITDFLLLNLLWLFCCIPIVTIFPATSAFYYVMLKIVKDEHSGIFKSFFHSFIENIKQGILLSLIFLPAGFLLYLDYVISGQLEQPLSTLFQLVFVVLCIILVVIYVYTVALQAQFTNTIRQTLKNAVFLSLRHFLRSCVILFFNALPILVMFLLPDFFSRFLPLWVFLVPSIITYFCSKQFRIIFDPLIEAAKG